MTNVTAAADASLVIDTVTVTSASNSVSDAITGMTFYLESASPGTPVTVTVESDPEGIQSKVQALVDAYNDLFSFIETQSGEDGALRDHPTMRTVADRMANLFTYPLDSGTGQLTLLAEIGITQTEGRQLAFDTTAFQEALSDSYRDVRDLLVENGANLGKAYLITTAIDSLTDPLDGLFKASSDNLDRKMSNMDDTIERYERSLDTYQTYLERKFASMEIMVATLQAQGNFLLTRFGS
jgi:flagellar hook-associated protein 2